MKKVTECLLLFILLLCPVHTTGGPYSSPPKSPATQTDIGPAETKEESSSPKVEETKSSPQTRPTVVETQVKTGPPVRQESTGPSSPKEEYKKEIPMRVVAEPSPVEETIIPEQITEAPTPAVKPKTVAKKKPIVVQLFDKDMNPLSIEINTELIGEYGALIWVDELECFISVKKGK